MRRPSAPPFSARAVPRRRAARPGLGRVVVAVAVLGALVLGLPAAPGHHALPGVLAAGAAGAQAADSGPQSSPPGAPSVQGKAYALLDVASGQILAAKGLHDDRLIASTVKIMTALTALRLKPLDSTITVSALAAGRPAKKIGMQEGQVWRLEDALYCLLVVSANDAAYAIAEGTAGSLQAFADEMKKTGDILGLQDSTFADPTGFDDSWAEIGPSRMSVYDLAVAGRALLTNPILAKIVATQHYEFTDPAGKLRKLTNHSRMLLSTNAKHYAGTDGIKTGYTDKASGTFVGSATRDGRQLIGVMLGYWDIYAPVTALMDWAWNVPSGTKGIAALPAVPGEIGGYGAQGGGGELAPTTTAAPGVSEVTSPEGEEEAAVAGDGAAAPGGSIAPVTTTGPTIAPSSDTATKPDSGTSFGSIVLDVVLVVGVLALLVALRRRQVVRRRRAKAIDRRLQHQALERLAALDAIHAERSRSQV